MKKTQIPVFKGLSPGIHLIHGLNNSAGKNEPACGRRILDHGVQTGLLFRGKPT
jgi:hypothetical protein